MIMVVAVAVVMAMMMCVCFVGCAQCSECSSTCWYLQWNLAFDSVMSQSSTHVLGKFGNIKTLENREARLGILEEVQNQVAAAAVAPYDASFAAASASFPAPSPLQHSSQPSLRP